MPRQQPIALNADECLDIFTSDWWRSKIEVSPDGCHNWTGTVIAAGYGQLRIRRVACLAHRVAVTAVRGPIPPDLEIDHVCRNRRCVNPEHLEVVTRAENMRRALAVRTTCPKGHPLEEDNLLPAASKRGHRACLRCNREISRNRARHISAAMAALGISRREYVATYGQSRRAALLILDLTED